MHLCDSRLLYFLHFLALNFLAPLCQVMNYLTRVLYAEKKQCIVDNAEKNKYLKLPL